MRDIERADLRAPALVVDIDIEVPSESNFVDTSSYRTAWCLIRRSGVPVAIRFLDIDGDTSLQLADVRQHFASESLPAPVERSVLRDLSLTVAICTRDRPNSLRRALESLGKQSDTGFAVVVIDNSANGDVAKNFENANGLDIRCCHEPVPGLSRARNRALAEVKSDLIAYLDDDEVADPDWIAWLKRGFASHYKPDVVVGKVLPADLESGPEVDWERYGGHNKGRGMEPELLRAGTPSVVDPLYPRPMFGSGGNMAFRTAALRAIGGFDNRLGAGTLTRGGEETKALSMVLDAGFSILHWPPAIAWHYHRGSRGERWQPGGTKPKELENKLFGNSAGLTAYYTSLFLSSPRYAWRITTLLPRGYKDFRSHGQEVKMASLPAHLTQASRRGLLQGPWLYIKEAAKQRRSTKAP